MGFVDILPDDFYHNSIRLSAAIESKLESDHDVERNVLKILLLGAGIKLYGFCNIYFLVSKR